MAKLIMSARTRNYTPKSKRILTAVVAGGIVVAGGAIAAIAMNQPAPPPPTAQTLTPTSHPPTPVVTPTPTPTRTVFPPPTPPPNATVDLGDPEAVAVAWANEYFTRPTGKDETVMTRIDPYISETLRDYMRTDEYNFDKKGYFDGSEGTKVLNVSVTPQDGSVGRDTPIRWSRTVTVTVQGLDTGRTVEIPYILELRRADTFWFIVGAPKKIEVDH